MSERLEHARRLGRRIDAGWQREDIEANLAKLHARQRGRARWWTVTAPVVTAIAAAVVVMIVERRTEVPQVAVPTVIIERPAPAVEAPAIAPAVPVPPPVAVPRSHDHEPHAPAIAAHGSAAPAVRAELPVAPAAASSWRDDAERGDYAAAWAGLTGVQLDGMSDLLLAGDVARLSGHPAAAVAPLARALALHPDDPRAPLAAFTLGRVHLEELGAPRDAAIAFARARQLAPDGPLAEDALAREVEAWSRAGETATARAQAVLYTQRYPAGRRVHAVRRFGGLERP